MCEYCECGKTIRSSNWNGEGRLYIEENQITNDLDEYFYINFCPMCGRKLTRKLGDD